MISLDLFTNRQIRCEASKLGHKLKLCIFTILTHSHGLTHNQYKSFNICFSMLFFQAQSFINNTQLWERKGQRQERDVCVLLRSTCKPVELWSCSSSWRSQRLFQLMLAKQALTWKLLSYWDTLYQLQVIKDDILSLWLSVFILTHLRGDKWQQNCLSNFAVTHTHWWRYKYFFKVSLNGCHM